MTFIAALAFLDPVDGLMHLVMGLLGHFVDNARADIVNVLSRYLFATVDTMSPGGEPLTHNATLVHLNFGAALMVDALMAVVVVYASLRSMFEHSLEAKYTLKVTLPRLMMAVVLAHGSMLFIQLVIDLNNAIAHAALSLGDTVGVDAMPWSASISAPAVQRLKLTQDVFHALFAVAIVVAVVVLALSYVVRTALLNILIVFAPLAALLWVLPDTRDHAQSWMRLFLATVFMQAVQMLILRVAVTTAFDANGGLMESLYALATLYLMLKVPGSLNIASHLETKAHTLGHHALKATHKAVTHHAVHHTTATHHAPVHRNAA